MTHLPIVEFSEHKTNYGIVLRATLEIAHQITMPLYESSIDHRKQSEIYLKASINEDWLRLRGRYKLIEALQKLETVSSPVAETVNVGFVRDTLKELLKELDEPQFITKGEKR